MIKEILEKIKKEGTIKNNDKIVLGFSGGPDSVFLLEVLLKLQESIVFEIYLVHINHLLRGKDADEDEEFVREISKKYGLKCFIKRADIEKIAKDNKKGLEEVGREIRYKYFNKILKEVGGTKIAIAHNLDDQIETFLFRLMRGSSLEGLKGIPERENIIRPIKDIYKKDIVEYLDKNSIPYRIDKTNFENEFTRNSIRLDLIPSIEKKYNSNFKEKISFLLNEICEVNDLLDKEVEKFSIKENVIELEEFKKLDFYLQKRVLNRYLKENKIEVSREKIENILNILNSGGTKEIHLKKDIILKKEYEKLKITSFKNEVKEKKELKVRIPFKIEYNGYTIETIKDETSKGEDEFLTNLLDGDELIIRTRKDGDKIVPIGMKSLKKIKEIFINKKIPKEKREVIPIIEKEGEIVWILGVVKSERFKKKKEMGIKLIMRRQNG